MEIIKAEKPWELAGVAYVRAQTMAVGLDIPFTIEFDEESLDPYTFVLVLDEGKPVGTCRLEKLNDYTAQIERVIVLTDRQKSGIGREMITQAEKWLRADGTEKVVITSRDEAVGFYESLGYTADWDRVEETDVFTLVYTEKHLDDLPVETESSVSGSEEEKEALSRLEEYLYAPAYGAYNADTQGRYEHYFDRFFNGLERVEAHLSKYGPYLLGDTLSKADVRLFSILVRFDLIYFFAFRLNEHRLKDYPALWDYARRLYRRPEFRDAADFGSIKKEFYENLDDVHNPYHLIPDGPDTKGWESE